MKTITKEYKLYSYDELSEESKQNVLSELSYINVDNDWHIMDDIYLDIAKEYGVHINMSGACYDLDRSNFLYFETYNHGGKPDYDRDIRIEDSKKFLKKAGFDLRKCRDIVDQFTIEHKHYSGSEGHNYIDCYGCTPEQEEKLQACLDEMIDKIKDELKDQYESLTSEEAIIDTINANEYTFLENGKLFS